MDAQDTIVNDTSVSKGYFLPGCCFDVILTVIRVIILVMCISGTYQSLKKTGKLISSPRKIFKEIRNVVKFFRKSGLKRFLSTAGRTLTLQASSLALTVFALILRGILWYYQITSTAPVTIFLAFSGICDALTLRTLSNGTAMINKTKNHYLEAKSTSITRLQWWSLSLNITCIAILILFSLSIPTFCQENPSYWKIDGQTLSFITQYLSE